MSQYVYTYILKSSATLTMIHSRIEIIYCTLSWILFMLILAHRRRCSHLRCLKFTPHRPLLAFNTFFVHFWRHFHSRDSFWCSFYEVREGLVIEALVFGSKSTKRMLVLIIKGNLNMGFGKLNLDFLWKEWSSYVLLKTVVSKYLMPRISGVCFLLQGTYTVRSKWNGCQRHFKPDAVVQR